MWYLIHTFNYRVQEQLYSGEMDKTPRKRNWTLKKALQHIRSYYREGISAADLLRLVNNSTHLPALSSNLYYQAYKIFCSSPNTVNISLLDCKFCECLSCIDFDYLTNHGSCSICGICFYIPSGNRNYTVEGENLCCNLDGDTQDTGLNQNVQDDGTTHTTGNARHVAEDTNQRNTDGREDWEPPPTPFTAFTRELFSTVIEGEDESSPSPPPVRIRKRKRKSTRRIEEASANTEGKEDEGQVDTRTPSKETEVQPLVCYSSPGTPEGETTEHHSPVLIPESPITNTPTLSQVCKAITADEDYIPCSQKEWYQSGGFGFGSWSNP